MLSARSDARRSSRAPTRAGKRPGPARGGRHGAARRAAQLEEHARDRVEQGQLLRCWRRRGGQRSTHGLRRSLAHRTAGDAAASEKEKAGGCSHRCTRPRPCQHRIKPPECHTPGAEEATSEGSPKGTACAGSRSRAISNSMRGCSSKFQLLYETASDSAAMNDEKVWRKTGELRRSRWLTGRVVDLQ